MNLIESFPVNQPTKFHGKKNTVQNKQTKTKRPGIAKNTNTPILVRHSTGPQAPPPPSHSPGPQTSRSHGHPCPACGPGTGQGAGGCLDSQHRDLAVRGGKATGHGARHGPRTMLHAPRSWPCPSAVHLNPERGGQFLCIRPGGAF